MYICIHDIWQMELPFVPGSSLRNFSISVRTQAAWRSEVRCSIRNALAGYRLGKRGLAIGSGELPRFLANQVGQAWDLSQPANAVLHIVPKA